MNADWNKSLGLEKFGPLKENLFSYPSMPWSGHIPRESQKSEHSM